MQKAIYRGLFVALVLGVTLSLPQPVKAQSPTECFSTDQTRVMDGDKPETCGLTKKSLQGQYVNAYLGIPFATAARWEKPKLAIDWNAKAVPHKTPGPACPQTQTAGLLPGYPMDENCLSLNVWAPAGAISGKKKLPVMVFIYGGAFMSGTASLYEGSPFDGTELASHDVIVVSFNYRLGALGFLAANAYGGMAGNLGLYDQQKALEWVQKYIAPFGGDPSHVTLFGESAGAMSVGLHTFAIPSSTGLFSAAIMESNPMGLIYPTHDEAATFRGDVFLKKLCAAYLKQTKKACDDQGAWLRDPALTYKTMLDVQKPIQASKPRTAAAERDPEVLRAAFKNVLAASMDKTRSLAWSPVIETNPAADAFITGKPLDGYSAAVKAKGNYKKPVMLGLNTGEGAYFAFAMASSPKLGWAFAAEPVFSYVLSKVFPNYIDDINSVDRYKFANQRRNARGKVFFGGFGMNVRAAEKTGEIFTDAVFFCGNVKLSDTLAPDSAVGAPVYTYFLSQPSSMDVFNPFAAIGKGFDEGACEPDSGRGYVCHANELPYVFNQLDTPTKAHYIPTAADRKLAADMNAAWATFAKDPANGLENIGWQHYAGEGGLARHFDTTAAKSMDPFDRDAVCKKIWLNTFLYQ